MTPEKDEITGKPTTGHEWNGIRELDTPVPRPIRVWLWGSIAVCVPLWLLYPAWPYVTDYTRGALDYSSRNVVTDAVAQGQAQRDAAFAPFQTKDVTELANDPALRPVYEPSIRVLYQDRCAACHGRELTGQRGFPNLTDDHWLWSGDPAEIEYTLQVGINADHPDTRYAEMPAFGRDGMLPQSDIEDVAEYVLSLSGPAEDETAADRGAAVFADNCAGCHNDEGAGGFGIGAPSLADDVWIYGGTRPDILETLKNGRGGVMPSWSGRLSAAEIRMLTLYVLWAGQDDKAN